MIKLPICGRANGETNLESTFATAQIARITPMSPSPAIRPEVNNVPRSMQAFFSFSSLSFAALRCSRIQRTTPPAIIPALSENGRYIPTANGSTGIPRISTTIAMNTPTRISAHGSSAFMIPSTSIFIIVACGAGISLEPNPHAAFNKYKTYPIAAEEAITPTISPIC